MKTIFRTYQFELQPTQEQKVLLDKHFECIRYVYNYFLNEKKERIVKNHKLAKHISDASWRTFVRLLEYKADWNDKQIVKINRWYPSSKTCNCGWINQNLKLSDRVWMYFKCGEKHDRNINAAKNILKEGLKIISLGTGDYTGEDLNQTSFEKHRSVKPEAHLSLANG